MRSCRLLRLVLVLGLLVAAPATPAGNRPDAASRVTSWTGIPHAGETFGTESAFEPDAPGAPPAPATDRDAGLRVGWPVNLSSPGAGFPYTPTLYDADGDGADEIFLTGGHTFGLRGDGSFLPGWPTAEMVYMGYGTNDQKPGPSAADLDRDGDSEILWSERDWWAGSAIMWCFNGKNLDASNVPGFPQQAIETTSNALDVPFVLGDADGDGDLEAWGPHTRGNNFTHYRVSAFDHLGTRLFTADLGSTENILSLYFGDLDGNGAKEMFAVSWLSPSLKLHVFAADGTEVPGYPIVLTTFAGGYLPFGPPVPADLDGDGDLEILLGHWDGGASRALCRHHDGTPVAGFPLQIATSSQLFYMALGDLTGDGRPELIAFDNHLAGDYRVHVLDLATGSGLPGWPYNIVSWPEGFPTIADVDNDGFQDVCLATDSGELHAISRDGQLIAGYPKQMGRPSISGVAAGDIDGDGLFELVAATWDGWVYAWDTAGEALPGRADWPMRNVNARNTGVFGESRYTTGITDAVRLETPRLRVLPNPVFHHAEFQTESVGRPVVVEILDPSGRLVERLGPVSGGRVTWEPRPSDPCGVYFARMKGVGGAKSVKLVVLR